jgi:hypothetical protein
MDTWLSGLCDPSEPTLRGSTTRESQPAVVKCGMCMDEDDADADEKVEEDEEEWGDRDEDGGAEVPFVAKRASAFCVVEIAVVLLICIVLNRPFGCCSGW